MTFVTPRPAAPRILARTALLSLLTVCAGLAGAATPQAPVLQPGGLDTAGQIRAAALAVSGTTADYPLPLAGSWATGMTPGGFDPGHQLELIARGHRLLPWFQLREPWLSALPSSYYEDATRAAARLRLPLTLVATQWDRLVAINLSARRDFNDPLSPFSPLAAWYEAGLAWGRHPMLARMQELYPAPPRILMLSNNEQARLSWQDLRSLGLVDASLSDEQVRRLAGDAWIERYRELMRGIRDGLTAPGWQQAVRFIGYDAFGAVDYFRWPGWIDYSLHVTGRFEPWPLVWDGASVSFYASDWSETTDFQVFSPQVGAHNLVPMRELAQQLRSDFWFELSVWDGQQPGSARSKDLQYRALGQAYDPARYEGFVQYGLWLTRPRLLREFRNPDQTRATVGAYFDVIMRSVDRVHDHALLQGFWREGRLVPNARASHPYQSAVPPDWRETVRWFMPDVDENPPQPWSTTTRLGVYALVLERGTAPNREWLLYAHSPLAAEPRPTRVHIPGGPTVVARTARNGCFSHVRESGGFAAVAGC